MQLGYRPKTNSYGGRSAAMWEQYLRDLVVFGCSAVELILPRSDAADSPLEEHEPVELVPEAHTAGGGRADRREVHYLLKPRPLAV